MQRRRWPPCSTGWGCQADLFPWVEVSVGAGSNGKAQPANFTTATTGEGSTSMGFYNVQQGDAPYLKLLADTYAMSDNYHQAVNGGTGANHIMLGTADAIWFSDGNGNAAVPPNYGVNPSNPGVPLAGNPNSLSEIENPNPQPGTNNYYIQDGYGGGSGAPGASTNYGGGSYTDCSDPSQPGVAPILNYLGALPRPVNSRCQPGHYYLLNNYNPGYFGDGSNAYTDTNPNNYVYTIPPSTLRNIGDVLNENQVSWAYYGDQFNRYLTDKYDVNQVDQYCNICNWAQYSTSIMTNAAQRTAHLKDTTDLYTAIHERLAAGGVLRQAQRLRRWPSGLVQAHPVRGLREEDRRRGEGQSGAVGRHGDFRHLRRGRRILGLGLRAAARLLRRRHPDSDDRGVQVQHRRPYLAHLLRTTSRWRSSSNRTGTSVRSPAAAATICRTRSGAQSVYSGEFARYRRSDRSVQIRWVRRERPGGSGPLVPVPACPYPPPPRLQQTERNGVVFGLRGTRTGGTQPAAELN